MRLIIWGSFLALCVSAAACGSGSLQGNDGGPGAGGGGGAGAAGTGSGGSGGACLMAPAGQDPGCYPAAYEDHWMSGDTPTLGDEVYYTCAPGASCVPISCVSGTKCTFLIPTGSPSCGPRPASQYPCCDPAQTHFGDYVCCDGTGFLPGSSTDDCPVALSNQDSRCAPHPTPYSPCSDEGLVCRYQYAGSAQEQVCCRGQWSPGGCQPADAGAQGG